MKIYNGNVKITKDNQSEWAEILKDCRKISGDVRADNGEVSLPVCAEVGGNVWADNGGKVSLPVKHGNNPTPIRNHLLKKGYLFADKILSRIISKRKQGEIVVYKTSKIGNRDNVVYCVQRGETFSHGETVKQAIHDLRYKLSSRDTTQYKSWTLDSNHSAEEIIGAYRAITGACEEGTKMWCEGKKLPAKLTVKEAIALTEGAYQSMVFKEFFKEAQ